ncbi:MAG: PTS beta-glucoside transporter subunit EIIBCA [Lachnospiraceae bacterium]|nr:PTS beta-glucoside transporter subunit EIIBCA [Lachnospiraceae bacterium]
MSKKYESLAADIVKLVGGKENINHVRHCQTRLRFTLADEKIADTAALEATKGVTKVIINAGVYQVVIGTHVADVFEEVEKLVDTNKNAVSSNTGEKKNIAETVIDFVAGTFQPIIPALSGAGMVKAVMALLVVFKLIDTSSQTYYMLNVFADGVFYFLPILLAFSQAQKLKCNPILAAGVAAMMLHPNWTALVSAGEPVHFFGVIPFTLAGYASSVIPIILVIFAQSFIEKFLKKRIPKSVELVFVPMLTFLIMGTLAFSVLGPIGSILGGYLAKFFTFLSVNASWAPAILIGGLLPVMVMFGIHNGVAPLGVMQMSQLGYDSIFGPGCVISNMCQATAGLVVALRTKDKDTKQTAASGSITAYMGITEPILYGINLPKKYPLISAMIGGACGGLYAGLTHTHRFATGSSGLPAVLLYIGDNTMTYFYNIIIAIIIGCVVTGVLTYVLSVRFEKKDNLKKNLVNNSENTITTNSSSTEGIAAAPVTGEVLPLNQAKDEAFASEALGKGCVIVPSDNIVTAPFSGTIATLFPTHHAIGIKSTDGMEIVVHIGIDTVELNGKHFEAHVKQGDTVSAGQKLVTFDRNGIVADGYSTQTMVIVTNTDEYSDVKLLTTGNVTTGMELIQVTR